MSNTDTNQASELFELCKQIYERTKWGDWSQPDGGSGQTDAYWKHLKGETEKEAFVSSEHSRWSNSVWIAPLYTSDYLLEKLRTDSNYSGSKKDSSTSHSTFAELRIYVLSSDFAKERDAYEVVWRKKWGDFKYRRGSNTLAKALLKLTIALSEAGEMK